MEYFQGETIQDKRDRGDPEQIKDDKEMDEWTRMLHQADADRQKKKEEEARAVGDEWNDLFESQDWTQ